MKAYIVIFAKAPVAGLAKTRLAPALGAAGAAALAARMLEHAVEQACAAALGPVEICTTPDTTHPAFGAMHQRHGVELTQQGEGDLGQRMHRAFERVLRQHRRALLIGTDAPALDAPVLCHAAEQLLTHNAVFVPALDGGYALVGLRGLHDLQSVPGSQSAQSVRGSPQADPRWFTDMPWSTPRVMALTRQRLQAAGVPWAELPAVADIDEPADLVHLPAAWGFDTRTRGAGGA